MRFARSDERQGHARAARSRARAGREHGERRDEGFARELEIEGVGYRAEVAGKKLKLALGFSHPIVMPIPEGLKVAVDRNVDGSGSRASIEQQVGQFAAEVRAVRPPEPYKGKGIRYVGERVRRKVGKAGAASRHEHRR